MMPQSIFGQDSIGQKYNCVVVCDNIAGGKSNITEDMLVAIDLAAADRNSSLFDRHTDSLIDARLINAFERDVRGAPIIEDYVVMGALRQAAKQMTSVNLMDSEVSIGASDYIENHVSVEQKFFCLESTDGTFLKYGEFVPVQFVNQKGHKDIRYVEVFDNVTLRFTVNCIADTNEWPLLWRLAENNGLGAARNHGYGKFVVTDWTKEF